MTIDITTACPHCGGKSGYEFDATERQSWSGVWGEQAEEFCDSLRFTPDKMIKCKDCDKRISREKINLGE